MAMHNPPHPGETLREDVLPALGLGVLVAPIAALDAAAQATTATKQGEPAATPAAEGAR